MSYGNETIIAVCDGCGKRCPVAEIKKTNNSIDRFCEQCLLIPHSKLVKGRKGREARDKEVGDNPHQPLRYTQTH